MCPKNRLFRNVFCAFFSVGGPLVTKLYSNTVCETFDESRTRHIKDITACAIYCGTLSANAQTPIKFLEWKPASGNEQAYCECDSSKTSCTKLNLSGWSVYQVSRYKPPPCLYSHRINFFCFLITKY